MHRTGCSKIGGACFVHIRTHMAWCTVWLAAAAAAALTTSGAGLAPTSAVLSARWAHSSGGAFVPVGSQRRTTAPRTVRSSQAPTMVFDFFKNRVTEGVAQVSRGESSQAAAAPQAPLQQIK